jgi:hypothetical protein
MNRRLDATGFIMQSSPYAQKLRPQCAQSNGNPANSRKPRADNREVVINDSPALPLIHVSRVSGLGFETPEGDRDCRPAASFVWCVKACNAR